MIAQTDRFRLDGKRALISGGSRGIGFGIARALASAGAELTLVARGTEALDEAKSRLVENGAAVEVYSFDVARVDEIPEAYAEIARSFGAPDILVNAAGLARRAPAHELSVEDWRRVVDVNLTAVFATSRAFANERIASGKRGKIINIASLMSEAARRDTSAYTASKGGVKLLTKALAVDWAPYGINVNAIGPGYIRTDLTRPLWEDREFDSWVKQRTPFGRWGEPEDIGGAAVFLASGASDFVTGQVIYVDGGWLATF